MINIFQNGPKWSIRVHNGLKKKAKIIKNCFKWPNIVSKSPKLSKMVQNRSKWPNIVSKSPKLSKMIQNRSKLSKVFNNLPKCLLKKLVSLSS